MSVHHVVEYTMCALQGAADMDWSYLLKRDFYRGWTHYIVKAVYETRNVEKSFSIKYSSCFVIIKREREGRKEVSALPNQVEKKCKSNGNDASRAVLLMTASDTMASGGACVSSVTTEKRC